MQFSIKIPSETQREEGQTEREVDKDSARERQRKRERDRERLKANTAQLRTAKGESNEIEYENLHSYCMGIRKHIYTIYVYTQYI